MSPTTYSTLVLGAGPTGLGAMLRLLELGETGCLLIEAEEQAGGLAASVVDDQGFTWDLGGHVQFSHYQAFDRAGSRRCCRRSARRKTKVPAPP